MEKTETERENERGTLFSSLEGERERKEREKKARGRSGRG